jgi:hypothetical protein
MPRASPQLEALSSAKRSRQEFSMAQDEKLGQTESRRKWAWILPALFGIFIVSTITFLMVIDAIYAPDADGPLSAEDSVGR